MRYKNTNVVVTGANGGMGKVIVESFLEEGANVVALDLNVDRLLSVKDLYTDSLMLINTNIREETEVKTAVQHAIDQYDTIDVLVNAAGIAQAATNIEEVSLAEWNKLMEVNATAIFLISKELVPYMKKQGNGVITNIISIAAERARPGLNAYVASKGAATTLTKALAVELAEHGIRVNGINPGPSDTTMLGKFSRNGADVDQTKDEIFKKSVPLGQLITPEDISSAVLYVSSSEAQMVTGSILNVDGGRGI